MVSWRNKVTSEWKAEPLGDDVRVAGLVADPPPGEIQRLVAGVLEDDVFVVEVLMIVARGVGVGFVTLPQLTTTRFERERRCSPPVSLCRPASEDITSTRSTVRIW